MPEHTLYVAPASAPCRSVLLHLHLLGAQAPELEVVPLDLQAGGHKSEEFLRHNPLHCVPTLVTPWGPLWESRAIMRYLESIIPEPQLYPLGVFHRAAVDRLLDWDLGTLYRTVSSIVYPQVFQGKDPSSDDLERLDAATSFLEHKQLGDGRVFLTGGSPTIADLACAMTLSLLRLVDLEIDEIPRTSAWQDRIRAFDANGAIDAPFAGWVASLQAPAPEAEVQAPPADAEVPVEHPAPEESKEGQAPEQGANAQAPEKTGDAA